MRTLGLAVAAGALLAATHASAGTFPVNAGLIGAGSDLIDQIAVRVYVHEGHRYCFYFNGCTVPVSIAAALRSGVAWVGAVSTAGTAGAMHPMSAGSAGITMANESEWTPVPAVNEWEWSPQPAG